MQQVSRQMVPPAHVVENASCGTITDIGTNASAPGRRTIAGPTMAIDASSISRRCTSVRRRRYIAVTTNSAKISIKPVSPVTISATGPEVMPCAAARAARRTTTNIEATTTPDAAPVPTGPRSRCRETRRNAISIVWTRKIRNHSVSTIPCATMYVGNERWAAPDGGR